MIMTKKDRYIEKLCDAAGGSRANTQLTKQTHKTKSKQHNRE